MNTKQIETELARIQGELDKFKALIADKEWKDGEGVFYVYSSGAIGENNWDSDSAFHKALKDQGNAFKTREEAELHSKRIRSLKRTCLPTERRDGYVVSPDGSIVRRSVSRNDPVSVAYYFMGRWHPTREEAEAWQAEFGECFRGVE